jgi:hypothetical protein
MASTGLLLMYDVANSSVRQDIDDANLTSGGQRAIAQYMKSAPSHRTEHFPSL